MPEGDGLSAVAARGFRRVDRLGYCRPEGYRCPLYPLVAERLEGRFPTSTPVSKRERVP